MALFIICYLLRFTVYLGRLDKHEKHKYKYKECVCSALSCPALWGPMDYSLPGSSAHGILQARILEWFAISFSRGFSQPRDQTCISSIGRQILYRLSHQGSPEESPLTHWQMPVREQLIAGKKTWVTRRAHRRGPHPSGTCSLD